MSAMMNVNARCTVALGVIAWVYLLLMCPSMFDRPLGSRSLPGRRA
jgi:hypothetical protein